MAGQWGSNTLGSGQTAFFYFVRPVTSGFLPVISVLPLTPSFTNPGQMYALETLDSLSFPTVNQLGVTTIWSQLSDNGSNLIYYMGVMNFSNSTIQYAFVETDI
jgi:hypothetical protein